VVLERAFCRIGPEKVERAKALIDGCKRVICTLDLEETGEWKEELREIAGYAGRNGKLERQYD